MALRQPVRSKASADRSRTAGTAATKAIGEREIPDKLYFRIGEVARLCEVAPYVLRFWESEFPPLKPNKGGTGQRLYRRRDVEMALRVKILLYEEGYTIAGARQILKAELRSKEPPAIAMDEPAAALSEPAAALSDLQMIEKLRGELQALLAMLSEAPTPAFEDTRPKPAAVQSIRTVRSRSVSTKPELASLFDNFE